MTKEKKRTVLCLDANNAVARMTHTHRGFTAPDGSFSGACFGLIRSLRPFLSDHKVSAIYYVEDRGVPEFRKKLVIKAGSKGYKSSRKNRPDDGFVEEYHEQLKTTPSVMKALGISVAYAEKFEADDVIACLCNRLRPAFNVIVYSSDADLVQLAGDGVRVFRPQVMDFTNTCSKSYLLERAILGDKSDDIPGVRGVGEGRLAKIMMSVNWDGDDLGEFFYLLDENDRWQNEIRKHSKQIYTVLDAIDLSKTVESCFKKMVIEDGKFDAEKLKKMFRARAYRELLMRFDFYTKPYADSTQGRLA